MPSQSDVAQGLVFEIHRRLTSCDSWVGHGKIVPSALGVLLAVAKNDKTNSSNVLAFVGTQWRIRVAYIDHPAGGRASFSHF